MKWYAVQKDRTEPWDNGTYDYDTARAMLAEQKEGLIAVIDEETNVCIAEIPYTIEIGD